MLLSEQKLKRTHACSSSGSIGPALESLHWWESEASYTAATRVLIHTTIFPVFPVFLAIHGHFIFNAAPSHLSYLCGSSIYLSFSASLSFSSSHFLISSFLLYCLLHDPKGSRSLLKPPLFFSSYLFSPLDLFFQWEEWFFRPVFFPAILKHRVTSGSQWWSVSKKFSIVHRRWASFVSNYC